MTPQEALKLRDKLLRDASEELVAIAVSDYPLSHFERRLLTVCQALFELQKNYDKDQKMSLIEQKILTLSTCSTAYSSFCDDRQEDSYVRKYKPEGWYIKFQWEDKFHKSMILTLERDVRAIAVQDKEPHVCEPLARGVCEENGDTYYKFISLCKCGAKIKSKGWEAV